MEKTQILSLHQKVFETPIHLSRLCIFCVFMHTHNARKQE